MFRESWRRGRHHPERVSAGPREAGELRHGVPILQLALPHRGQPDSQLTDATSPLRTARQRLSGRRGRHGCRMRPRRGRQSDLHPHWPRSRVAGGRPDALLRVEPLDHPRRRLGRHWRHSRRHRTAGPCGIPAALGSLRAAASRAPGTSDQRTLETDVVGSSGAGVAASRCTRRGDVLWLDEGGMVAVRTSAPQAGESCVDLPHHGGGVIPGAHATVAV